MATSTVTAKTEATECEAAFIADKLENTLRVWRKLDDERPDNFQKSSIVVDDLIDVLEGRLAQVEASSSRGALAQVFILNALVDRLVNDNDETTADRHRLEVSKARAEAIVGSLINFFAKNGASLEEAHRYYFSDSQDKANKIYQVCEESAA